MPRNKSEKVPSCPEAHAYLEACKRWLEGGERPLFAPLWRGIPRPVRERIMDHCGTISSVPSETQWRRSVVAFIGTTYGS